MTNTFNKPQIMRNQAGEFTVVVGANADGMLVTLVCESEECAKLMAAHLDSMVKRVEIGEVAF